MVEKKEEYQVLRSIPTYLVPRTRWLQGNTHDNSAKIQIHPKEQVVELYL